jgi:uncharacterized membrane protein
MSIGSCCSPGWEIFGNLIIPEGMVQRRLGDFYKEHPVMSRLIATPIALISGIIKVFLFPLICLVGMVVMPIVALVCTCRKEKNSCEWLSAWGFCILGVTLSVTFLAVSCYYLPLVASMALLIAFISASIISHVRKLVAEPLKPPPFVNIPLNPSQ